MSFDSRQVREHTGTRRVQNIEIGTERRRRALHHGLDQLARFRAQTVFDDLRQNGCLASAPNVKLPICQSIPSCSSK
jgi:hypothetical protein